MYSELDITTNFSFLRGASHADELVPEAARLGLSAVAVTDLNTLAGVVRAHLAAKESGIHLCVGSRLRFVDAPDVLVWVEDRQGYANLCRLLTSGKRRAEKAQCTLYLEDLLNSPAGLLAAVVGQRIDPELGDVDPADLQSAAGALKDVFGNRLSLTISRLYQPADEKAISQIAQLGRALAIPLLATNQVHYHDERRRFLQDILTCIRHGCTIGDAGFRLFSNGQRFIKSPREMQHLFYDLPGAIRRSAEIAEWCTFSLEELRYEYPDEVVPMERHEGTKARRHEGEQESRHQGEEGISSSLPSPSCLRASVPSCLNPVSEYLAELTWTGARQRYPNGIPEKVRRQIEHELVLIRRLKIEPYFLTVFDLVRFARGRGILCQGRGSAANSAVCYCLGVTSVDPDRIDVLFERFVSAARDEPPDIDIDFEHERREEVIQYVYEKYGRDRAGMTAEVISYRGRSAVRDVGKALGLGLDAVDHIAKTLDWWHSGKLSAQQLAEAGLDPNDRTVRILVDLTHELLGFPRHLGQHVGGMVMTRGALCELVPIENAVMPDRTVIEWDKDDIDALGILKVDVLGLGMLTCISKALKLLNERHEGTKCVGAASAAGIELAAAEAAPTQLYPHPLELHTLPPEDPAVYEMISDADTIGVFQIESRAQMSMLPRLRPEKFYDLVIEVAIVRPGPIQGDMVHPYLRRRRGEEVVEYPSEALRNVLEKTLGVPLFQEQAMKVAMVAAGFSAGEADQLRRAMAAWRHAGKIEQFHKKIIDGMLANGYTGEFAERCFNQIKGFAEYGFPESHAASFALLVYASSWIKRHHPAVFCCALLNSQPMGFYQPAQIVRDAREHGVEVRPIDVNSSDWDCTLEEEGGRGTVPLRGQSPYAAGKANWGRGGPAVRLGFRQIKGMRQNHADIIVQFRRRWGGFVSVEQFQQATQLPRSVIERLAEADAFASLPQSRRMAIWGTMGLSDEEFPLFGEGVGGQSPLRSVAGEGLEGERDTETQRRRDGETKCAPATSSLRLSVSSSLLSHHASGSPHIPTSAKIRMGDRPPSLPPMSLQQEVMTDYATAGLSLKRHPVSFVRRELTRRGIITAAQLAQRQSGWVSIAGIVLIRQRPGTASGIVFVTLEDETGVANLIIRPDVFDRFSLAARKASLLQAEGRIQREGQVIHVMTYRLSDLTQLLSNQEFPSRDFR